MLFSDFNQRWRLEEATGIVQRRPLGEMHNVIGVIGVPQQLVADHAGAFSDIGGLVEYKLPGRIGLDLVND